MGKSHFSGPVSTQRAPMDRDGKFRFSVQIPRGRRIRQNGPRTQAENAAHSISDGEGCMNAYSARDNGYVAPGDIIFCKGCPGEDGDEANAGLVNPNENTRQSPRSPSEPSVGWDTEVGGREVVGDHPEAYAFTSQLRATQRRTPPYIPKGNTKRTETRPDTATSVVGLRSSPVLCSATREQTNLASQDDVEMDADRLMLDAPESGKRNQEGGKRRLETLECGRMSGDRVDWWRRKECRVINQVTRWSVTALVLNLPLTVISKIQASRSSSGRCLVVFKDEVTQRRNIAGTAKEVGRIKFIVFTSLPSIKQISGKYANCLQYESKPAIKERIQATGIPHAFLHLGAFLESYWKCGHPSLLLLTFPLTSARLRFGLLNKTPTGFPYVTSLCAACRPKDARKDFERKIQFPGPYGRRRQRFTDDKFMNTP
ncbi:hypothetical protein FB45DRAFT_863147 [Roridomyces roridus]|uniref:NmrA-like domain-containing protein n=1 Tax=Roridomyces roridus TaxID=1738132 RepID=A0AAD7FTH7_9AGAR|nr:hypothetical protein FB45DRAFT_863147 [Roridomyces roridus]